MHAWNLHIDFDIETSQEDKVTDSYNPRNGVGNGHESGLGDTPGTQPTEPLPSSSFPYYPTGQNSEGSGQRGNDPDGRAGRARQTAAREVRRAPAERRR